MTVGVWAVSVFTCHNACPVVNMEISLLTLCSHTAADVDKARLGEVLHEAQRETHTLPVEMYESQLTSFTCRWMTRQGKWCQLNEESWNSVQSHVSFFNFLSNFYCFILLNACILTYICIYTGQYNYLAMNLVFMFYKRKCNTGLTTKNITQQLILCKNRL